MNAEYKDFIGYYSEAVPRSVCNAMIAAMDSQRLRPSGLMDRTNQVGNDKHLISDQSTEMFDMDLSFSADDVRYILDGAKVDIPVTIDECVAQYLENYPVALETVRGVSFNSCYKLQATLPGEGYNLWHSEWTAQAPQRFLVWILYLNDIEEGGETEFLYYPQRIRPRAGDLIVWPAGFTHSHRGNPPLKDKKYIMTGWITQH